MLTTHQTWQKNVLGLLAGALMLLSLGQLQAQHSLQPIWQTDSVFKFVEGVIPDPTGKMLYVSNTIGSPMGKDGQGSISTVGLDGKIINLDWVTGMNAPKDIQMHNGMIYAADLDEVVVVDAKKAQIVNRIKIDSARLLHNIAIDPKGVIYVTDMFPGKVYRIENNKPSLYIDKVPGAAGVLVEGTDLYVLTGGSLLKYDKDKKVTTVTKGMDNRMNGLQRVNDKEFLVTSWGGVLYYVNADGTNQILLDNRPKNIPCGIIYYDKKQQTVYMTSDQHNVLYAYKVK